MKRGLVIGFVLGLAVAWAAPAMAIDWSASGYIAVLGNINKSLEGNALAPVANRDEMGSWVGMRARLRLNAKASKDLSGVLYFEMDANEFGDNTGGRNQIGRWGADQVAVEVKNVYINFRVPQTPVWARVGVQPAAERTQVFLYNDAAGVKVWVPLKQPVPWTISAAWYNNYYGDIWESNEDSTFYLADANFSIGSVKPGLFFAYQNMSTNARINGAGLTLASSAQHDSVDLMWLGLYMDGKIGPVQMELDGIYLDGTANARSGFSDIDYSSWLIRAVASYVWNKMEFGGGGMYVRGRDYNDTTEDTGFPLVQPADESCAICGDFLVFIDGWFGTDLPAKAAGIIGGPQSRWPGFWYLRGFAYYQVVDWLKLGAQVAYIGNTEDNGNFLGGAGADDGAYGWELDVGFNINIYKNLVFNGGFGYLVAGDAFKNLGPTGDDLEDPWTLVASMQYTF